MTHTDLTTLVCQTPGCVRTTRRPDTVGWWQHTQPGRRTRYWCPTHAPTGEGL